MAGVFSKSNRPKLEGAYFNWEAKLNNALQTAQGSAVAIAAKHSWGPVNTVVQLDSLAEFQSIFGPDSTTDAYVAVREAFKGEGVNGRGGAGEVLFVRLAGTSQAAATGSLKKTGGEAALPLKGKYLGTYGNKISTIVEAAGAGLQRLRLLVGGVEVERYTYAETNITKLSEEITARSGYVALNGSVVTGTKLETVTTTFASGVDGTVTGTNWTEVFTLLATQTFVAMPLYGQTEGAIITAFKTWVKESNELGHRFFGVVGKAAGTLSEAIALATEMGSPEILVCDGIKVKDLNGGAELASIELDGTKFCARVAGVLAGRGEYQSITAARFADLEMVTSRSLSEQLEAFEGGVVTLARDSHPTAPVHIKTGLSSWTSANAAAEPGKPYLIYRQPKYVKTMHGIETELTQFAEEEIIGLRPIDKNTKAAIIAQVNRNLEGREKLGVIQPGFKVEIDQNPPPQESDEFIALAISLEFGRALEQVYFTVSVS